MKFTRLNRGWRLLAGPGFMALAFPTPAKADYCFGERVTALIIDGSYVQFTTDKSCPNWCRINPSWTEAAVNRAYSQLALAIGAGKAVVFFWEGTGAGCPAVPVYSTPSLVWVGQ